MKNQIIVTLLLSVIVAGASFFAGLKYQESKRGSFNRQFGTAAGQRMGLNGNRAELQPVAGEIISRDDKSVTIKMTDGGSKIVFLSEKTTINKAAEGTAEDLKVGVKVAAFGSDNADGSVTAQNIQINPTLRELTPRTETEN